jgi:hypothetical protein
MVHEILRHEAALGQDDGLARIAAWGDDADNRRLAKGVNLLELLGGEKRFLVAVEDFNLVGNLEFLQEPYDALRAGVVQPAVDVRNCERRKEAPSSWCMRGAER